MSSYKELISENKDPLLNQHVFRPVNHLKFIKNQLIYYDIYEDFMDIFIEIDDTKKTWYIEKFDYKDKSNLENYYSRINHPNNNSFNLSRMTNYKTLDSLDDIQLGEKEHRDLILLFVSTAKRFDFDPCSYSSKISL